MRLSVLIPILAVLALVGCRQSRPREVLVEVPGMNGPECQELIQKVIAATDGVDKEKIAFDLAARTVTVGFDSMRVATKNIEHAIADVGFDANSIPADVEAQKKLPETCR